MLREAAALATMRLLSDDPRTIAAQTAWGSKCCSLPMVEPQKRPPNTNQAPMDAQHQQQQGPASPAALQVESLLGDTTPFQPSVDSPRLCELNSAIPGMPIAALHSSSGIASGDGNAGVRPRTTADATASHACEVAAAQMLLAGRPLAAVQMLASRCTHASLSAALQLCAIIHASGQVSWVCRWPSRLETLKASTYSPIPFELPLGSRLLHC